MALIFFRQLCLPAPQKMVFEAQLALAASWQKPFFLHCSQTPKRFIVQLKPWLSPILGGVVPCFTGSGKELYQCLDLGLSIGIRGWVCDERLGLSLQALLPKIQAERLLTETDAPYLLPRDLPYTDSTTRNEPCFLSHIITPIACWRQQEVWWLKPLTEHNVSQLFQRDHFSWIDKGELI